MVSPGQRPMTPPTIRLTIDALPWDSIPRSAIRTLNYFRSHLVHFRIPYSPTKQSSSAIQPYQLGS